MAGNLNKARDKQWWSNKYHNSSPGEFKKSMRIEKDTFDNILRVIQPH